MISYYWETELNNRAKNHTKLWRPSEQKTKGNRTSGDNSDYFFSSFFFINIKSKSNQIENRNRLPSAYEKFAVLCQVVACENFLNLL